MANAPENTEQSNSSPLKIAGFGACMLSGYPYEGGGMFEVACGLVEKNSSLPVQTSTFNLGGFPAPRAEKYLKEKVLGFSPNYVVIQFGSTDAVCPIRPKRPSADHASPSQATAIVSFPSMFTIVRWQIQSLVAHVWEPEPVTSLQSYVAAIKGMVNECIAAHATPIVLSPFVFGSRYSTRNATNYTDALRHLFLKMNQVVFIDCVQLLSSFPRAKVLLRDGMHLSRVGQGLVGEAIGQAIIADITVKTPRVLAVA